MDFNTNVAVNIMVKTSLGNSSGVFNREISIMQRDAAKVASNIRSTFQTNLSAAFFGQLGKNAADAFLKSFAGISKRISSTGIPPPVVKSTGFSGYSKADGKIQSDAGKEEAKRITESAKANKALQADSSRFNKQRQSAESTYTNFINREAEKQYQARLRTWQKGAKDFERILNQQKRAEQSQTQQSGGGGIFAGVLSGNLASRAIQEVTGALVTGGLAVLDYSSKLEQAKIGFTTMTGSAILAQKHLDELQAFAAKTPFEFGELVTASQKLQGVGVESQKVIPLLNDVGNALAAAGRIGDLPFAVKALGDIQAKGKLAGQEIIQLANAGLPALDILSKSLGKSRAEIIKLSEAGKISSEVFFEAIHQVSEARFGDAMLKQSRTFGGALSNIKDGLFITASTAFKPLYDQISSLAVNMSDDIQSQGKDFTKVGEIIAGYVGKGLGLAIGEVFKGIGFVAADLINAALLKRSTIAEGWRGFLEGVAVEFNKTLGYAIISQKDAIAAGVEKPAVVANDSIKTVNSTLNVTKDALTGLPTLDSKLGTDTAIKSLTGITAKVTALKAELDKVNQADSIAQKFVNSPYTFKSNVSNFGEQPNTLDKLFGSNIRPNPLRPVENIFGNSQLLSTLSDKNKLNAQINKVGKGLPTANADEVERQQKLALIKLEQGYREQEASLKSHLTFTTQEQLNQTRQSQSNEQKFLIDQIKIQTNGFNKQIAATTDDVEKQEKITGERNEVIAKLNGELRVKTIDNQKQIAELEQKILDERRVAQIEFYTIANQQAQDRLARQRDIIRDNLDDQIVNARQGYDSLIGIQQDSYTRDLKNSRQQLALQVQDRSLSNDQRLNLILKASVAEQNLTADNNRAIKDLERQRTKAMLDEIKDRTAAQLDFIQTVQESAANFSSLGDVSEILNSANFDRLLGKAKKLSEFFIESNRGQAEFFNSQSQYYRRLGEQAQSTLERLLRQRESILPTAQTVTTDPVPVNQNNQTYNSPFMNEQNGVVKPVTPVTLEPPIIAQIDDRQRQADTDIAKLRDDVLQYKGIADKFETLTERYQKFAFGISQTYGQLQAEVFGLYDTLGKSVNDNTVFDKIIEKSFLAQRALEEANLSVQVEGLTNQLTLAQKELQGGNIAPVEVARLQSELNNATQKMAAFNFETEVGKSKLDTLANAAQKFNDLLSGDAKIVGAVRFQGELDAYKQKSAILTEIYQLEAGYYKDTTLLALQKEKAVLEADKRIYEANQKQFQNTIYSASEANAKVAEFLASQKSVTEASADFKIGLVQTGYDFIDAGLDRIIPKMGKLGGLIKDLLSSFLRLALNAAFRRLFGLDGSGGGAAANGQAGNKTGGFAGIAQSILGGISGGGSGGGGFGGIGTAVFNPNAGSGVGGAVTRTGSNPFFAGFGAGGGARPAFNLSGDPTPVGTTTGIGAVGSAVSGAGSQAAGGIFAAGGGLRTGLAGALPALGLGLGAQIGGGRGLGGILGSAGGLLLGGAGAVGLLGGAGGAAFATGGSLAGFGGAAAFLTNPFTIAAGAGILIAAYFIGRAARRRKEKKEITQASGDALAKIQSLLADVKAFKIDGATAYQQGTAIRDSFQQSIANIKTKPGKKLAQQKLGEIDTLLASLKSEGDRSDRIRQIAKTTDEKLVPTFAVGGFTGMNYGGQLAVVHSHEAILRQQDIMALGGYRALQDAGVRGMDLSGSKHIGRGSSGKMPDVYVVGVFDEGTADEMLDKMSHLGIAKKVTFAAKKDLGGMIDTFAGKLSGKD